MQNVHFLAGSKIIDGLPLRLAVLVGQLFFQGAFGVIVFPVAVMAAFFIGTHGEQLACGVITFYRKCSIVLSETADHFAAGFIVGHFYQQTVFICFCVMGLAVVISVVVARDVTLLIKGSFSKQISPNVVEGPVTRGIAIGKITG